MNKLRKGLIFGLTLLVLLSVFSTITLAMEEPNEYGDYEIIDEDARVIFDVPVWSSAGNFVGWWHRGISEGLNRRVISCMSPTTLSVNVEMLRTSVENGNGATSSSGWRFAEANVAVTSSIAATSGGNRAFWNYIPV